MQKSAIIPTPARGYACDLYLSLCIDTATDSDRDIDTNIEIDRYIHTYIHTCMYIITHLHISVSAYCILYVNIFRTYVQTSAKLDVVQYY